MDLLAVFIALILICLVFWAARALLAAFAVGEPVSTVVMVCLVVITILMLLGALTGSVSLGNLRLRG
jgi:uncharacterized membrane protein YwzB